MDCLPKELVVNELTKYLNVKECYNLSRACKTYLSILTNKNIWQRQVLNKISIDPEEFRDVINDIENYNNYKLIPNIQREIKEIQSSVCIYVYTKSEERQSIDMCPPVVPGYNYGPDCLRRIRNALIKSAIPVKFEEVSLYPELYSKLFDTPYVSIKNNEHNGIPEFIHRTRWNDYIYRIDKSHKIHKIGKVWRYKDHIYLTVAPIDI